MTNSQRGFAPILILLAIIAGAAVAGGGYYVVSKRSEASKVAELATSSKSPEPSASASPAPSPSISSTPIVTAKPQLSTSPKLSSKADPFSTVPANQTFRGTDFVEGTGLLFIATPPDFPRTVEFLASSPINIRLRTKGGIFEIRPQSPITSTITITFRGLEPNVSYYGYVNGNTLQPKRILSNSQGILKTTLDSSVTSNFGLSPNPINH